MARCTTEDIPDPFNVGQVLSPGHPKTDAANWSLMTLCRQQATSESQCHNVQSGDTKEEFRLWRQIINVTRSNLCISL